MSETTSAYGPPDRAVSNPVPMRLARRWVVHPYVLLMVGTSVALVLTPFQASYLWWTLGFYLAGMFIVTGLLHRYFSHRAFKTSRVTQFVFAVLACTVLQLGPLWWAAHHRHHHRHSDEEVDLHSPRQHGLLWAQALWLMSEQAMAGWRVSEDSLEFRRRHVPDLYRYPELVLLERHWRIVPFALMILIGLTCGLGVLVWGYLLAVVVLNQATNLINSLAHVIGTRRYETRDDSRNSLILALITLGEGWHNNHHCFMGSANQGFRWYEIDITFYVLWVMSKLGIIWDLRMAPVEKLEKRRIGAQARAASE